MAYFEDMNYGDQPVNPYDYQEDERKKEELKRQLEEAARKQDELASQVSHKQEVLTYGDGSRTVKTTKEIPPTGPVAPDYNAQIAQQESGNRPDIGYHAPGKSTAYGTYGMTSAGYEDARRLNPNLPADITQTTPEQQTAAQNAYTQQNAKYLQGYGVEPTPQNLAAAHFLGAKGLSDYLKTGQISEAAAKANGGYENVKRIVDRRLGGQPAPASGAAPTAASLMPGEQGGMPTAPVSPYSLSTPATQQVGMRVPGATAPTTPAPTPEEGSAKYINAYQQVQDDPAKLMQLSTAEGAPDWMKDRARNRAADVITQQREMAAAQEKLSNASPSELAKYMREKTTGGSWVKALFYSAIGAKQLAQEEGAKLGIGTEKVMTGPDGKAAIVKISGNGTPLNGYSADTGKQLTPEELIATVGGASSGKVSTSAEQFQDKEGNLYRSQSDERGRLIMRNAVTGEVYKGDPTKLSRARDVSAATADERKQGFKRENFDREVLAAIQKKRGQDVMGALSDFEANSPTPLNDEQRMSFIRQYGGLGVPGQPSAGTAQVGGVRPSAPVAPQGGVPVAPVSPQVANAPVSPVAPTGPAVMQGPAAGPGSELPTSPMANKPGYDASGKPTPIMGEGTKAFQARLKDWQEDQAANKKVESAGKQEIVKNASEVIANAPGFMDKIDSIDSAIKLTKQPNNLGRIAQGTLPFEQTVGAALGTKDANNTKRIMAAVQTMAAEGMKTLGANPTDSDRDYLTKNIPDESWSAEDTRDWLQTRRDYVNRKIDTAKKQIKTGGTYLPDMPNAAEKAKAEEKPAIAAGTTQVVGGVTYVFDGKGWKKR